MDHEFLLCDGKKFQIFWDDADELLAGSGMFLHFLDPTAYVLCKKNDVNFRLSDLYKSSNNQQDLQSDGILSATGLTILINEFTQSAMNVPPTMVIVLIENCTLQRNNVYPTRCMSILKFMSLT